MKKILLILILVLTAAPVYAFTSAIQGVVAGSYVVSGGCACETTRNTCTGDDGAGQAFCYYDTRISLASQFTAAASKKICKASLRLKKDGDTGNNPTIQYCIYSDDGETPGKPNAVVGTCSATMNVNSLTTSYADVMLTGMDVDITNGTKYHIVVTSSAQCTTDLVRWGIGTAECSAGSNGPQTWGTITPVWTNYTTNSNMEYTLYSCD